MTSLTGSPGTALHRQAAAGDQRVGGGLMLLVVMLLLVAVSAAAGVYCCYLLLAAAAGEPVPTHQALFYGSGGCFLLAAGAVVLFQSLRVGQRVAGPEQRLIQSLRRIRAGDLAFRVHLRRGDLLTDLACECNALIDYLNANPPVGAITGNDVFEVDNVDLEPEGVRP